MPDQTFTTLYPQAGDPELLLLAKIAAGVNGRTALEDTLSFDGTTAAGRAFWTLGTAGNVATCPFTLHAVVETDATSAAVVRGIWALSSLSTAYAATSLALYRSSNDLVLELTGATAGTDYRRLTFSNWFTNTPAALVPITVTWSRTAAPIVYVRGVAVTGTETTGGTAPAWTDAIVATYLVQGVRGAAELWNARQTPPRLLNVVLTAAQALALGTGGRLPAVHDLQAANFVYYVADWSAGVDFWSSVGGDALTGNVDAIGTPATDNTLRVAFVATASQHYAVRYWLTPGVRYRVSGSVYIPPANTVVKSFFVRQSSGAYLTPLIFGTSGWVSFSIDFTADLGGLLCAFANSGGTENFTPSATDLAYLAGWRVEKIGAAFFPVVQPCRIVDDAGANQIGGVLTAGVLPVTAKMDFRIAGSVSTAAIAAVQLFASPVFIDPTVIALDTIEIKPTGTPTLSIGDGTTVTKYTASAAKTAVWTRETISANYPADVAKTGVTVNVTATGGTTCAVVIRGHRTA